MRVAEDQASLGHRSDLRNGGSSIASPGVAAMTTARAPGRATPPCPAGPCPLRWRGLALRRGADYGWSGARGDQTPQDSFQDRGAGRDRRGAERSSPQLGWPRETDSLCPTCVREVRAEVLAGRMDLEKFVQEHPGEIKARIVERDGRILMEKECPKHGRFEDVMSIDAAFLERIEKLFQIGRA